MRRLLLLLALTLLAAPVGSASAAETLQWTPCLQREVLQQSTFDGDFECSTLVVPLDRAGVVPGELRLRVARPQAEEAAADDPVVVVMWGTAGAATTAYAPSILEAITNQTISVDIPGSGPTAPSPGVPGRIVTVDLRGTGAGALRCPTLERLRPSDVTVLPAGVVEDCAARLGPARDLYGTAQTVEDLEALRAALGVEQLTLVASGYPTRAALRYAERYPARVARLVLDSVVPRTGYGPAYLSAYPAIRVALRRLCVAGRCRGVTTDPVADLARTLARVRAGTMRGTLYDERGRGVAHRIADEAAVLDLVREVLWYDLWRGQLPAALAAAAAGDPAPLVRLDAMSRLLYASQPRLYSAATHAAVLCADLAGDAGSGYGLPPGRLVAPFSPAIAEANGLAQTCARWPAPAVAPTIAPPGPLPRVPTLILQGEFDVVAPPDLSAAERAGLPGARVVTVPAAANGTIYAANGCARLAVARFLAGRPVGRPCRAGAHLPTSPSFPRRLTDVDPVDGVAGQAGRVVAAALATVGDAAAQAFWNAVLQSGSSRPALLRGGRAVERETLRGSRLDLAGASFVPGVRVTGVWRETDVPEDLVLYSGTLTVTAPGLTARFSVGEGGIRAQGVVEGTINGRPFTGRVDPDELPSP